MTGICERCGIEFPYLHKHHVKPRVFGGKDEDGIEYLCPNCHALEHGGSLGYGLSQTPEANAKRKESMKKVWEDPEYRARAIEVRKQAWADPVRHAERAEAHREKLAEWREKDPDAWEERNAAISIAKGGSGAQQPAREILLRHVAEGLTQTDIAKLYGVAQSTVGRWFKAENIVSTKYGIRVTADELADLLRQYTVKEVAAQKNVTPQTIQSWKKKLQVETSRRDRVSDSQRERARALLSEGYSYRAVAEEIGFSHSVVERLSREMGFTQSQPGRKKGSAWSPEEREKHEALIREGKRRRTRSSSEEETNGS